MPAYVGIVKILNMGGSSIFNIGDVNLIYPVSNAKTFAGAGSFNTGDGLAVYNQQSVTSVNDSDLNDQNIVGNI
ncbi:spore germination protein [Priestia taiwanensis]|uniref:Germination protein GerPA n=1 Tax=Priestia taiwanensis TaxID=1347902 RepID=A0A917ERW6_9BACI|nr:spore germination protein [Priestia taiwanensis]MBM7364213.1 spore germination protein PA [Priestia taiwanensis]GGE72576.1 germination protein GerPA [Priestia taiwanensis]